MRLDDPDDDVHPLLALGARRFQHLVSLANPRRGPKEDLQSALSLALSVLQQCFWRRPFVVISAVLRHGSTVSKSGILVQLKQIAL